MALSDRIERAKWKTNQLVNHALNLLSLHAANQIIVYSPQLSSQIPHSHAAHAFNAFQDASLRFEIIRLCAVLDPCRANDLDKESVPAVVQLIDDPDVLTALEARTRAGWGEVGTRVYDQGEDRATKILIEKAVRRSEQQFALERGAKARRRLERAIRWSKQLEQSPRLKAVRNLRDKYLAHSLEQTALEKKENVERVKYGDERQLLWKAVAMIDALHRRVNGAGFAWSESIRMSQRNAAALWNGCSFKVDH